MTDTQRTQREIDLETARGLTDCRCRTNWIPGLTCWECVAGADTLALVREQGARSLDARVAAARAEALREAIAIALDRFDRPLRGAGMPFDVAVARAYVAELEALAGQPAPEPARTGD